MKCDQVEPLANDHGHVFLQIRTTTYSEARGQGHSLSYVFTVSRWKVYNFDWLIFGSKQSHLHITITRKRGFTSWHQLTWQQKLLGFLLMSQHHVKWATPIQTSIIMYVCRAKLRHMVNIYLKWKCESACAEGRSWCSHYKLKGLTY